RGAAPGPARPHLCAARARAGRARRSGSASARRAAQTADGVRAANVTLDSLERPMATSGPKRQPRSGSGGTLGNRRTALVVVAVVLILAVAAGAFFFLRGNAGRGFSPLNGRWFRLDGGYVLEIRGVDASGKMDASYLNPRPINVAKAQATRDGSTLKVFV